MTPFCLRQVLGFSYLWSVGVGTGLFAYYFDLLAHAFFVDVLEDVFDAACVYAFEGSLCGSLVEYLGVALGLDYGEAVVFLVLAYLATDGHAACKEVDEVVVYLVDALAEGGEGGGEVDVVAYDEHGEDVVEYVGGDLLAGIAPGFVGVAVALDDEAVHAEVHGLLA